MPHKHNAARRHHIPKMSFKVRNWPAPCSGTAWRLGVWTPARYLRVQSLTEDGRVAWILRLVKIGADGENQSADVMTINRPDDLGDIATPGLTLAEGKLLLAGLQQEIVAPQARGHAARRPDCCSCGLVCRVKDYRAHRVATLFGQVMVRLPRFCCAGCGGHEAGHGWPSHCRSTPELDQIQAHLAALMTYRVAADVLVLAWCMDQRGRRSTPYPIWDQAMRT